MSIIKSARFVQPFARHSVIIEMNCDHDGAAPKSVVSVRANTQTFDLMDVSGIKDGPAGDALIAYLRAAAKADGGRLRAAVELAASKGW